MPSTRIALLITLFYIASSAIQAQNSKVQIGHSVEDDKQLYWLQDSSGKHLSEEYNYIIQSNWVTYYQVKRDGLFGTLDGNGSVIVPIKYEELEIKNHGIIRAKIAGKCGLLSYQNKTLIPFDYEHLSLVDSQVIIAFNNDHSGLLSYQNELILPITFDQIQLFKHQVWALKNGLWGAYSIKGKLLLPHQYSSIKNDHYGKVTVVRKGQYFGIVDSSFQEVVMPIYTSIQRFSKFGTAPAKLGEYYGAINAQGKVIVPFEFKFPINTNGTLIPVRAPQSMANKGFYAHDGRMILAPEYDIVYQPHFIIVMDNKWGALTFDGDTLLPFEYQFISELENNDILLKKQDYCLCSFSDLNYCSDTFQNINGNGYAGFYKVRKNDKYGLLAQNWQLRVNPMCEEIYPLQNNKMRFELAGKQGYFDPMGNIISASYGYDEIRELSKHAYLVKKGAQSSILNDSFHLQMPFKYDNLFPIGDEYLSAFTSSKRCGLLNYKGDTLLAFGHGMFFIKDELLYAKKRRKWAVYDKELNQIVDYQYNKIESYNDSQFLVRKGKKWTIADTKGLPINNNWHKGIRPLTDSLLLVWNGSKSGIADGRGKLLLPYQYDYISSKPDGGFFVKKNGLFGIINADFTERISPISNDFLNAKDGRIIVRQKAKFGLISDVGDLLIPLEYDHIQYQSGEQVLCFKVLQDGLWALFDDNGTALTSFKYSHIDPFAQNLAIVALKTLEGNIKFGLIDSNGKEVIPAVCDKISRGANGLMNGFVNDELVYQYK